MLTEFQLAWLRLAFRLNTQSKMGNYLTYKHLNGLSQELFQSLVAMVTSTTGINFRSLCTNIESLLYQYPAVLAGWAVKINLFMSETSSGPPVEHHRTTSWKTMLWDKLKPSPTDRAPGRGNALGGVQSVNHLSPFRGGSSLISCLTKEWTYFLILQYWKKLQATIWQQ